jgi:hypothetical protein
MRLSDVVDQTHPSFGCQQAWFTVAVCKPGSPGAITRLLLVEARNEWAVATIERVAASDGGRVSPNSFIVAVHRNCSDVAMRSALVDEIDYVDFMLDLVEPGRILQDAVTATAFRSSLDGEDLTRARMKLKNYAPAPVMKEDPPVLPVPVKTWKDPGPAADRLASGLISLGFKATQVKKLVESLGDRPANEPIESLMREAISRLRDAA